MKKFFIIVILLLQSLPSYGMLGEGELIEESRVYTRTLNFRSPRSSTECSITSWVRQHAHPVRLVAEWLNRVTDSPINVALAQITIASPSEMHDFPLSEFITSKTKLTAKVAQTPITATHIQRVLNEAGIQEYDTYGLSLVGNFYPYSRKEEFKGWLRELLTKDTRLSPTRVAERLAELDRDRLDFFYHSEQAILLSLLRDPNTFWTRIFAGWVPDKPIEVVALGILSYYDPCRRCGDCLLRVSEDLLKASLTQFFETKGWEQGFLEETTFFIRVAGLNPYNDPLLDGSRSSPLRPRSPSDLKAPFANPLGAPIMLIVPRVGCAAEGWLR